MQGENGEAWPNVFESSAGSVSPEWEAGGIAPAQNGEGSGFRQSKWARPVRGTEGGGGVLERGREARRKGHGEKADCGF
jgi:hypothetical protein